MLSQKHYTAIILLFTSLLSSAQYDEGSFEGPIKGSIGISSGVLAFGSEASKLLQPGSLISGSLEVGYNKLFLRVSGSVTYCRSKNYIRDRKPWNDKSTFAISWPYANIGWDIYQSKRWRLRPNVGYAALKISEDDTRQIKSSGPAIGFITDFRLKKLNEHEGKSCFLAIRLEPVVMRTWIDERYSALVIGVHLGLLFY